ncbi:DoxX family protein [Vulgatibacter sp.]|uniref:DoxX family protein n=1 Tax=Vulgatibacter sp. TaxID=1971226 RepID=UPI0035683ECD
MLRRLLSTTNDSGPLIARLVLGFVMFPHGAQHALGWFGGYGFGGTFGWMTETLGFPTPLAALAIVTELIAPIALVLGIGGRYAALGIGGLMLGAASTHVQHGFFMNWFGAMPTGAEGYEYHLLALALSAVVAIKGSGAYSVDGRLFSGEVAVGSAATSIARAA